MTETSSLASLLVPLGGLGGAIVVAALWPARRIPPIDRVLGARVWPWLIGALTALLYAWLWGALDATPVVHDEAAYLLQAGMLAHGHLSAAAPPVPEFFDQFHILVAPVFAAKYPPGFALALVPGVWLGLPGSMVLVLTGVTGGLLFALGRRTSGGPAAIAGWTAWILAPLNLTFRPAFFSETLTSALWLSGWWCLLEWRRTRASGWLMGLALLTGWQAITRPLTAVAFAVPVGLIVLFDVYRAKQWRPLGLAVIAGALCLTLMPLQNKVTTGRWSESPFERYTHDYFPFDHPGFGLDSTPPRRELPDDFAKLTANFSATHTTHTIADLPRIALQRAGRVAADSWGRWWIGLALLALVGALAGGRVLQTGLGTSGLLLLAYLVYAHPVDWTAYYMETVPVLALLAAVGASAVSRIVLRATRPGSSAEGHLEQRRGLAVTLGAVCLMSGWPRVLTKSYLDVRHARAYQERFRQKVAALPGPAVVFIRYGPDHDVNRSLIANAADLNGAHAWLVYDRGSDNARLVAHSAGRTPYLYDEAGHQFFRLEGDGVTRVAIDSPVAR